MKRSATANWKGSGKEGKGTVTADSGVLSATPISFKTRFEEVQGTSPEELVAAAHSGCFSMKLSFVLGAAGFTPDNIDTKCTIPGDHSCLINFACKSSSSSTAELPLSGAVTLFGKFWPLA